MSQVRSDTKFMKKLKKFLKIKPRVKNINYNAKTGQTPKAGIGKKKMSSFREDTAANKKLQQETNDAKRTTVTYKRVTSKNKDQYSNQHLKKDKKKKTTNNSKLKAGSARERLRAKNVKRFGKAHVDRLVAKNKEFQAAKKDKEKMKAYRKKYGK